jgi:ATP-binding protein involved in chromosome partitioning
MMKKSPEMELQDRRLKENMDKIKNKIVVMSGKGGVGKSTVTANIAYGLALEGYKVGVVDADIHGPNMPIMLGVEGEKLRALDKPFKINDNLSVVSLSFYLGNPDDPIIWRGPAKISAIRQFLADITWDELDYLVVDLPPGTGDEPLTIAQNLGQVDACVIVSTPQDVALLDTRKSVKFAKMVNMPVLGIVENMSGFVCPDCGKKVDIFKSGGVEKAAKELGIELLAKIPLEVGIAESGDEGKPYVYFNNGGTAVGEFNNIINKIVSKDDNSVEKTEEKSSLEKIFKIAFPTSDKENVDEHFGHCKEFAVYNVQDKKILSTEFIDAPPHQPGLLPKFLGEKGADTIITGGMGQKAIDLFKEQNIDVILGASGRIENILKEYIDGMLYSKGSACNHDH